MPSQEAEDGLVEYFRCISGEHSDWDEYRAAMRQQGKSLIRITVERVGPGRHRRLPAGPGPCLTSCDCRLPCCSLSMASGPALRPALPAAADRLRPRPGRAVDPLAVDERLRARIDERSGCPAAADRVARPRARRGWCTPPHNGTDAARHAGALGGRAEPSGDVAVDEAADGVGGVAGAVRARSTAATPTTARGAHGQATVHYEQDYDNAFWDGTQLVFGDGDGRSSTGSPSRSTCSATSSPTRSPSTPPGWSTRASPGALNESVSDVFASCLKQRLLGQDALDRATG